MRLGYVEMNWRMNFNLQPPCHHLGLEMHSLNIQLVPVISVLLVNLDKRVCDFHLTVKWCTWCLVHDMSCVYTMRGTCFYLAVNTCWAIKTSPAFRVPPSSEVMQLANCAAAAGIEAHWDWNANGCLGVGGHNWGSILLLLWKWPLCLSPTHQRSWITFDCKPGTSRKLESRRETGSQFKL